MNTAPISLSLFVALSFFWVVCGEARQPELNLAGELQTHREVDAFSEEPFETTFHFIAGEGETLEFAADLYQVSTALAAPLVRDLPPEVVSLAPPWSVVSEVRLSFDLPKVERQTTFLLLLKYRRSEADPWRMSGKLTLRVHPPLDWGRLQAASAGILLKTAEDGELARFLGGSGFVLNSAGPLQKEGSVSEVRLHGESGRKTFRATQRPAADGSETWDVFFDLPDDVSRDAAFQIALYEILETILHRK